VLSALTSQVTTLTSAVAGGITLSSVQNANYTLAATDLGTDLLRELDLVAGPDEPEHARRYVTSSLPSRHE
jgi:hypothetical protein